MHVSLYTPERSNGVCLHFAEDLALGKYHLMMYLGCPEGHGKPVVTEMTVLLRGANSQATGTS